MRSLFGSILKNLTGLFTPKASQLKTCVYIGEKTWITVAENGRSDLMTSGSVVLMLVIFTPV